MLAIGENAPEFSLPDASGAPLALKALRPAPVVLYFYPKSDTPGCTTEALDFSRLMPEFEALGARVLGISKDPVAKQGKFCAKHGLSVTILSDAEGQTCEDYGVWGEKSMYGKTYLGITRATYLIDSAGKIAQIWPKVSVKGHAEEVLAALKAL